MAGKYPEFADDASCRQYVREYLPFHLTQIEAGLFRAYEAISASLPVDRPIRVLDIGAGPGSVAMALERLTSSKRIHRKFVVDTIEPSLAFARMIEVTKAFFHGGAVQIGDIVCQSFQDWILNLGGKTLDYDWVVAANCLSPLAGDQWKPEEMALLYRYVLEKVPEHASWVTLIEGTCAKFLNPSSYMAAMEKAQELVLVAGSVLPLTLKMPPCRYYRTKWGNDRPNMIMITMKVAA